MAYTLTYVYETDMTQNKCIAIQFKKWVFTYESPVLKTMTMSDERMNYGTFFIFIIIIKEIISLEGICILVTIKD